MSAPTFLVSRTDAIGDVVLTLPVAGWLKQQHPGCRVVLIGRRYTAAVAAACPWVDEFLEYGEQLAGPLLAELRSYAAAAIIHVFPNKRLARLAKEAKIPIRIGTRNRLFHWLTCNRLVALSRRHSPLHEAQLNLQLLAPLGYRTPLALPAVAELVRLSPAVPLRPALQALLAARQPGQLNVILHPRSRGSAREWGLAHFGQLARLLHAAGHRVFISGTADEGAELAVANWFREHRPYLAADLTGQLDLPEFIAFIAAADGLVAGSTGPLHLAAALGRHALGLYPPIRPMHPGRWGPLGPHAGYLVFDRPDCQDCRTQPAACTCIKAIAAATVAAQIGQWQPLAAT
jgi:heptosyltransferase-3